MGYLLKIKMLHRFQQKNVYYFETNFYMLRIKQSIFAKQKVKN